MRVTIYALVDPRKPSDFRYVGQTSRPAERLRKHRRCDGRDRPTYRGHWIAQLHHEGTQPDLVEILRVQARHKDEAERGTIRRFQAGGYRLTNGSAGGDGGALNPEIQARVNEKLRLAYREGRLKPPRMTPGQRVAANALLSRIRSGPANPMKRPEVRRKNAESQRARALAQRGGVPLPVRLKKGTPEHVAMRSALLAARSPEQRAITSSRISAALKGRPRTETHRAALRAVARRALTPEQKAAITLQHAAGGSIAALARLFCVSQSTIARALGRTY